MKSTNSTWFKIYFVLVKCPSAGLNLIRLVFNGLLFNRATIFKSDGIWFQQKFGRGCGVWSSLGGLDYDENLKQALNLIREGDVVVDLGANVGAYTLHFAERVGASGKVIAVEANPEFVKTLRENIKLNKFNNIHIVEGAAASETGLGELTWQQGEENSASIFYKTGSVKKVVPLIKMQEEFDRLGLTNIRFIKMDIEGAETSALWGMLETLNSKNKPILLFENSHQETSDLLVKQGYRIGCYQNGKFKLSRQGENLWAMKESLVNNEIV